MQLGIHLIRIQALPALRGRGVDPPEPWIGVLDLVRAIEGLAPEPPADTPLGIVGLDALIGATGPERDAILRLVRRGLHGAHRYFEWRRVPLCFLVQGRLHASSAPGSPGSRAGAGAGPGPELELAGTRCSLDPLFGRGLQIMTSEPQSGSKGADWWWAPQLG